jgi:hypothetical protein
MKLRSIQNLSSSENVNFLKTGLANVTEEHLLVNYHPAYADNNANLFYVLDHGRFSIGNYYIMETDDGEYAGSAGWNKLNDEVALALVRAYVPKKFRTNYIMGEYILPKILEDTKDFKRVWLTFNDYNKVMYDGFTRMAKSRSSAVSIPWPEIYNKFKPIGKHMVNNTLQYVAEYERSVP